MIIELWMAYSLPFQSGKRKYLLRKFDSVHNKTVAEMLDQLKVQGNFSRSGANLHKKNIF